MSVKVRKTRNRGQNIGNTEVRSDLKRRVLDEYMKKDCLSLSMACRRAGVHPSLAYYWQQTDPEWKAEYTRAREVVGDRYVEVVSKRSKKSDLMLMFLTKAYKSEFRDRPVPITANIDITTIQQQGLMVFQQYLNLGEQGEERVTPVPRYLPPLRLEEGCQREN